MTTKELVSLNPRKIRHNNELMQLYIQKFEAAFSYKPNCAGCTFNKDFNKLKKHVNSGSKSTIINLKPETMSAYKIKPKFRAQILTYVKDKRSYRTYGRNISDQFAKEFLTHGTEEQLAERKKMFDAIPSQKQVKPTQDPVVSNSKPVEPTLELKEKVEVNDRMSRSKLDEIASEKGLNPDDYENKKLLAEAINNA